MTFSMKVLVVEDDANTIKQWEMAVELYNSDPSVQDVTINLRTAIDLNDATRLIEEFEIDAAIVDINLHTDEKDTGNRDGNRVLEILLESELAVVSILSGEPGLPSIVTIPHRDSKIEIFEKGTNGVELALNWLLKQVPMVKQINLANKQIKREMVKLFTRSIWPRWNQWVENSNRNTDDLQIGGALTRHLTAHVYTTFLEKDGQKAHPEEWYFVPPIHNELRTGDLIKNENGDIEILLTPRCDLARDEKNETFQLAICKDVSADWDLLDQNVKSATIKIHENSNPSHAKKLADKLESEIKIIKKFAGHKSNSNVYHFLPRISLVDGKKIGPFLINFDKIRSVMRTERESLIQNKFASVTPDFLPSIVERLGSYFSRIGTPDYSHPD